jgi:hypothetical protein
MLFKGWYPVNIRESRYGGAYSDGLFIITCGASKPQELDAFGGDTECMMFWKQQRENGPIVEIDTPFGKEEVYVESAESPSEAYKEFVTYLKEEEDYDPSF